MPLRCVGQSDARPYGVLHLPGKIIFADLKIGNSKMQPFSGNVFPDWLPMCLTETSLAPHAKCIFQISANVPHLPLFLLPFRKVRNPLRLPRKTTSELQKVARDSQSLILWTCKCALRHKGVRFFDIYNFKKCSKHDVSFEPFDFEMRFAPQWRSFQHLI